MKKVLSTIFLATGILLFTINAQAQGCVALRGSGTSCVMPHADEHPDGKWIFSTNARYFKSYKHFKGRDEQKERVEKGTEVINHQTAIDLNLTRILDDRWSIMIDVPLLANARSSLYEHGLVNGVNNYNERHSMHSYGLGDIRIAVYRWLLNPRKVTRGNIQAGLGIKFATGDYDYKDYWYNVGPDGAKELRTVDQSIQLGDGGTGLTTEINAYYNISRKFGSYLNAYYLINPREQNGVRTYRETLSPALANEAISSVPDQYMFRAGITYSAQRFTASAGARLEGIPVNDLVGGSGDFRRPGYVWSVEPGIAYQLKKINLYASVPVAFVRNRTQSVTDKARSTPTNRVNGDAAFADYVINAGFSVRF